MVFVFDSQGSQTEQIITRWRCTKSFNEVVHVYNSYSLHILYTQLGVSHTRSGKAALFVLHARIFNFFIDTPMMDSIAIINLYPWYMSSSDLLLPCC